MQANPAFFGEVVGALPASRYVAIDSGLSGEECAAIPHTGVSLMLPRNPSLADLVRLSRESSL